jgi:transposase
MAKYRQTDSEYGQGIFLAVNLKKQLLPGTFEHMLDEIIDTKIDTSVFDLKYKNDNTGASAIPPKTLLKLVIYGYSKGRKSSRGISELNINNIIAKALTGDMNIHWTTIADFISGNGAGFKDVFVKVLTYCNELDLIGGQTFAIDGLRLPSNASLHLTGKKEQLEKRLGVYRKMAQKHLERHRRKDERGEADEETKKHFLERQKKLNRQIEKISEFLEGTEKKEGKRGQEIQSNVTDNESAMIMSPSGYIQGYIGVAVSDRKNQVIISAEAVGSANECEHMPQMLDDTLENMEGAGVKKVRGRGPTFLADANYFSEENLRACEERGVEAVIPDSQYKKRLGPENEKRYEADDFKYIGKDNCYECPQGKRLEYKGTRAVPGREGKVYKASVTDCRICTAYTRCIRSKKDRNAIDKGRSLLISGSNEAGSLCREMRKKMNTEEYHERYAQRIQIIEPVFANIEYCKGLNRFTLRGRAKVNGQWNLYCIMHNLGKCLKGYNKKRGYA